MYSCSGRIRKITERFHNRSIILYLLFAVLMVFILASKKNLHEDEVFTYGLANSQGLWQMAPTDMQVYSPPETAWLDYVAVQRGGQFDFRHVWTNQAVDVHPPVYYALVHIICSFFPEKFSIWYAGIINIIFALLALWAVRRLLYELTENGNVVIFGSLFFILSAGILSAVSFLRMYMMAMFEVTFITLLFIYAKKKECSWKIYISLIAASVVGALTHYYFIIYLFFLCLFFGIYWLVNKKYKNVGLLIISMLTAGILSIAIFPSMIDHIFRGAGERGKQSFDNLRKASFTDYQRRLSAFYNMINEELFGGILSYLLIALLLFFLYYVARRDKTAGEGQEKQDISKDIGIRMNLILVILPSICYYLLVSKIAVIIISRYLFPIYGVVTAGVIALLYHEGRKVIGKKNQGIAIACVLLSVMIVNSWKVCTWDTLYLDSEVLLEKAAQYKEENAVCIYHTGSRIHPLFFEASNYNSITFLEEKYIESLPELPDSNCKSLIVIIDNTCDVESVLDTVLEMCPNLSDYIEIGSFKYTVSYYLYS